MKFIFTFQYILKIIYVGGGDFPQQNKNLFYIKKMECRYFLQQKKKYFLLKKMNIRLPPQEEIFFNL
jgi:hypothetical protein